VKNAKSLLRFGIVVPLLTIILAFSGAANLPQHFGIGTDYILLAALGLLAVDSLIERHHYHRIVIDTLKPISKLAQSPTLMTRSQFHAQAPLETFVSDSKKLLISGTTLLATIGPFRQTFRDAIRGGKTVRFLLLDESIQDPYLDWVARLHGLSAQSIRKDLAASFGNLKELADSLQETEKKFLEVKTLQTVPPASILMRDEDISSGLIFYQSYPYKASVEERPTIRLTPADNMYQVFRKAIEALWNESKDWNPA
jgi:hypothetical protein